MTSPPPTANATPVDQLQEWMSAVEGERFEFKEAKNRFPFEEVARYCCAMANEGGGKVILGVTDRRPRRVVGTRAFPQLEETRRTLMDRIPLNTHDFLALDLVHREEPVPASLHPRLRRLAELGAVETIGRGRGTRYLLSRRFHAMVGKRGAYTRRRGLDDETHKELLLKHLRENQDSSALAELHQILPQLSRRKVQALLRELRREGRVLLEGARRWARWKATKDGQRARGA